MHSRAELWAPPIDLLEKDLASVVAQGELLLEQARDELRRIQDIDAELADEPDAPLSFAAQATRHAAAHRLRWIARRLTRAQAMLVPPTDERYAAARQIIGWLDEAQDADAPWRSLEAVESPPEAA